MILLENFNNYVTRLRLIDQSVSLLTSNVEVKEENVTVKNFNCDTKTLMDYMFDLDVMIHNSSMVSQDSTSFNEEAQFLYNKIELYLKRVQVIKTDIPNNTVSYMLRLIKNGSRENPN